MASENSAQQMASCITTTCSNLACEVTATNLKHKRELIKLVFLDPIPDDLSSQVINTMLRFQLEGADTKTTSKQIVEMQSDINHFSPEEQIDLFDLLSSGLASISKCNTEPALFKALKTAIDKNLSKEALCSEMKRLLL